MPYRGGRRWMSLVAYLLFASAGVLSAISPLTSFTATVALWLVLAWSFALTIGGLLGVAGILKRDPALEFAALPLQVASVMVAGVVFIARGVAGATTSAWGAIVVGMLMLALASKLLARWFDIGYLVRGRRQNGRH